MSRVLLLAVLLAGTAHASEKPARADAGADPLPQGARLRLGTTRLRHVEWVVALAYSPDGQLLASVDYRGSLRLWDAKTGRLLRSFDREAYGCWQSVAFSPDGTILVAAGGKSVRLWETATGGTRGTITTEERGSGFSAAAFTPDGKCLVTAGEGEPARLRDLSGRVLRTFGDASFPIGSVAVSPDGRRLVVAFGGGERRRGDFAPRLYDFESGRELRRLGDPGGPETPLSQVSFSHDGRRIASTDEEGGARVWETASGREVLRLRDGYPEHVAFSPDGRSVATSGRIGFVDVWELATGRRLRRFPTHGDRAGAVVFSPDGKTLAAADPLAGSGVGSLSHIRLWDLAGGTARLTFPGHQGAVSALALSADGKTLASGGDGSLLLWNLATGRSLGRLDLPLRSPRAPICLPHSFSPDGRTLRVLVGGRLITWDLAAGKTLQGQGAGGSERRRSGIYQDVCSPDGSCRALVSYHEGAVELWDAGGGRRRHRLEVPAREKDTRVLVRHLAFSSDSALLATGSWFQWHGARDAPPPESVHVWDVKTGRLLRKFRPAHSAPDALAFSPDRTMLAVLDGWREPPSVWDVHTGRLLRSLDPPEKAPHDGYRPKRLCFSLDGRLLVLADDMGHLLLYATATGRLLHRWRGHDGAVLALLFSADGRTLFTGSLDTTILAWDLSALLPRNGRGLLPRQKLLAGKPGAGAIPGKLGGLRPETEKESGIEENGGRELFALRGHDREVTAVAFSPDGGLVLTASDDGLLRLSEAGTGRPLRTMNAGQKSDESGGAVGVLAAAFSPDGTLVASAGADGCVRLWDVKTGREVRTLTGHDLKAASVAFAPDGKVLVSAGFEGKVCLWDVASGKRLRSFRAYRHRATAAVFARDGRTLYTGGVTENRREANWPIVEADEVRAWDAATGKERPRPGGRAMRLLRSADGKRLVLCALLVTFEKGGKGGAIITGDVSIGTMKVISLRDLATGKESLVLRRQGLAAALAPDGGRLATAAGSSNLLDAGPPLKVINLVFGYDLETRVLLHDAASGRLLMRLPHTHVSALTFSPDGKVLATAGWGETRLWDVSKDRSVLASFARRGQRFRAADLARLWGDLGGEDAALAFRAVGELAGAGDRAVSFLSDKVRPRGAVLREHLEGLIAALDAPSFKKREQATRELQSLGPLAENAVRAALGKRPSLEMRQRLERVQSGLGGTLDTGTLRRLRAVEVLEVIGTAAARRLLGRLAEGTALAPETVAARAALDRLATHRRR